MHSSTLIVAALLIGLAAGNAVTARADSPPAVCAQWEVQWWSAGDVGPGRFGPHNTPEGWEPFAAQGVSYGLRRCVR
ncbi:MAG TPA: hypothetical protein VLX92_31320 [Kofleriaceae bacterium]|nr:hypothetical protein [Kofleriaceae bacterium]